MKIVNILGAGPAGIAALVAMEGRRSPSRVWAQSTDPTNVDAGARFLHLPVPMPAGVNHVDIKIEVKKIGEQRVYVTKSYGDRLIPFSSWDSIPSEIHGYDVKTWYDAWFNPDIIHQKAISSRDIDEMLADGEIVISAIPKYAICKNKAHNFDYATVFIGENKFAQVGEIVYNGDKDYSWFRASNLNGNGWAEWGSPPPYTDTIEVNRPLGNDCDCWDEHIQNGQMLLVGRNGEWRKGVLISDAYVNTKEFAHEHNL